MDIKFYNQGSQGDFLFNLIKRVFQQAGILGLSAACFLQPTLAADRGSQQGDAIKVNNGDHIIADTTDANGILYGVLNPYFNTGTVDLGNDVTVTAATPTGNVRGVLILGDESKLTANRLAVNAEGEGAVGLLLSGDKVQADLGSGSQIKVTGTGESYLGRAAGIQLRTGSTLRADRLSIETQGENGIGLKIDDYGSQANLGSGSTIKTNGRISYGVYVAGLNGNSAYGPAVFTSDRLTIDTQGNSAYGMNIQENSIVDLGQGSQITTDGEYAFGIWSSGDVSADALTVFTRGKGSHGIEILEGTARIGAGSHVGSELAGALVANTGSSGAGNPLTNVTLNYFGTQDNRNSLFSGGAWGALARGKGANINLKNTDITVDSQGKLSTALWAQSSAMIAGENITVNGAQGTRGIYAETGSQVDLTGTLAIVMADVRQTAIATEHREGSAVSRINASGKMVINGGIESKGGLINIDMASGSVWTGNAFSDNVNGGALNLSMNDSRWNVVSASNLDNLALNNSTVDFSSAALTDDYYTLQVGTLSGAGTFVLRTDIVGEGNGVNNAGDKLVVTGASSGNHLLTVLNRGDLNTTGHEVLTVVETADGKARGTRFTATSQVELGGYLYDVRQNGNNWELYSAGSAPDPTPTPPITPVADAGGNFLNVGYLLNFAETQTLMQRMGDLRQSSEQGNAWIRGFSGRFDSFASGKLSGFNFDYSGTQFGFDKRITPEIPFYVGTFLGLTQGSPGYRSGNGTVQSHHMGLYTTWMGRSGFYVDGVAKVSWLKNSFSVHDSQKNRVSGQGKTSGVGFSLEMGQKFALSNHLYIEPQAQLSYAHQNAARFKASNGLNINLSRYESMIGRSSVLFGYEAEMDSSKINAYLKTGLIREFKGNTAYTLNNAREAHSFKGNAWSNGLGVSASLNNTHTLYLEADSITGKRFNQRQINGGYRFSF